VTDEQTDGQTDRIAMANFARKNIKCSDRQHYGKYYKQLEYAYTTYFG